MGVHLLVFGMGTASQKAPLPGENYFDTAATVD